MTTDLNAQLKRKGHLNKKQSKEFLQSVGMLEELCLGMNQKIQREIDEVDYAYRQLQKKMSGIPFIQSSLLTRIQQAKGSLEYLEATDEINWESINMINAIHRIMIEGTQNGYPILEDARQRTRRAESQWTNRLAEQKKLGVYSEQETTFFMKKVALLLSNIDNYQREALTQMEQKNFETAKYTVETRVEGALDQYLIPSLNRLGRDAQEKFLLASSGLHNIVSDIQHFVIWVLGLSTLMLYIAGRIEGFRIIINHVPHLRA